MFPFFLIVALFAIPPIFLTYSTVGHENIGTILVVGSGSLAFSLMALNLLLATRFPGLDGLFSGLDRVYFVHKCAGISILLLLITHEYIEISQKGLPQPAALETLAEQVAKIVFFPAIFLLCLSFLKRIPKLAFEVPYQWWKFTHFLMGPLFAAITFHMIFVRAPFKNSDALGVYLTVLAIIGLSSFAFTQIAPRFRKRRYEVTEVTQHPSATLVALKPTGRPIKIQAGNFAFTSFDMAGLREPHPFTVSKIGGDGSLQFLIRPLGDFTSHLREKLNVGTSAYVEGGYGRFDYLKGGDSQVWVAGGIGITPFLAWSDTLPVSGGPAIDLIYCVKRQSDAVEIKRLEEVSKRIDSFKVHIFESSAHGRLDAKKLKSFVQADLTDTSLWFCGPKPMRKDLLKDLKKRGEMPRSVHFERFEFR